MYRSLSVQVVFIHGTVLVTLPFDEIANRFPVYISVESKSASCVGLFRENVGLFYGTLPVTLPFHASPAIANRFPIHVSVESKLASCRSVWRASRSLLLASCSATGLFLYASVSFIGLVYCHSAHVLREQAGLLCRESIDI